MDDLDFLGMFVVFGISGQTKALPFSKHFSSQGRVISGESKKVNYLERSCMRQFHWVEATKEKTNYSICNGLNINMLRDNG